MLFFNIPSEAREPYSYDAALPVRSSNVRPSQYHHTVPRTAQRTNATTAHWLDAIIAGAVRKDHGKSAINSVVKSGSCTEGLIGRKVVA